uniref:Uncharacterized protein n=1 Tax=Heterorhabditis bacteriophora TaxID=37862 RepID=A0A1I7XLG9_HETBA
MSGRQSNEYSTIVSMRTPDVVGSRTVMSWSSPGRDCNYINNRDQQVVLSNSTPGRPSLNRGQSQIQQALSGSARFMGLGKNEDGEEERNRWDAKRMRFLSRNYGLCDSHAGKQDPAAAICMSDFPHTSNSPADIQRADTMAAVEQVCHGVTPSVFFGSATYARSQSNESRARLDRRDSAIRVVYDSISSFITRGKIAVPKQRRVPLTSRCSFDIDLFDGVASSSVNSDVIEQPPCLVQQGTDIHHGKFYLPYPKRIRT